MSSIAESELIGSGKNKLTFDQVAIDKATAHVGRKRRRDPAAAARAEAAARQRTHDDRLRDAGTAAGRVLARMERRGISIDRQVLSRLSGEFAQTAARVEAEIAGDRGRADQCRQPQADRRHHLRQDGDHRRHQDQDRRVVDLGADPRRPRRAGPRVSEEDPGMAAGLEAEIDLYRRAAGIRPSADPPRAHDLRAGRDHHGTAVVERAEPAEHSGPHRGRPQDPPRLRRRRRATSWYRPTIRRSSCGCSRRSPTFPCSSRRSATGSTFTP